ncbi:MAG: polyhydroxyalkanoate synthesis repressor PhaR [Pseudomonadota bacterium]
MPSALASEDVVEDADRVVIKKYANRRLYNTASSAYVTLDNLSQMVRDGVNFVVFDAKSGEDITRTVLTQIIVEEESKGRNLLPISFLRQLIAFYGHNMQWAVPAYLDHAMAAFIANQDNITKMMQGMTGGMFALGNLEDVSKQNIAVFEKTMSMLNPFGATTEGDSTRPASDVGAPMTAALRALQSQMEAMQTQLQTMASDGGKKKGPSA